MLRTLCPAHLLVAMWSQSEALDCSLCERLHGFMNASGCVGQSALVRLCAACVGKRRMFQLRGHYGCQKTLWQLGMLCEFLPVQDLVQHMPEAAAVLKNCVDLMCVSRTIKDTTLTASTPLGR